MFTIYRVHFLRSILVLVLALVPGLLAQDTPCEECGSPHPPVETCEPEDDDDDGSDGGSPWITSHPPTALPPPGPDPEGSDYPYVYIASSTTTRTDLTPQIIQIGGTVFNAVNCEEGKLTFPEGADQDQTCEYVVRVGETDVQITSATNGGYGIDGADTWLTELSETFDGLPTNAGNLAEFCAMVGGKITAAAGRIADARARQLVDITLTVPRQRVIVTCAPAMICVDGQLVDAGIQERARQTQPMPAYRASAESVLFGECPRVLTRLANGVRLDPPGDDPCACENGEGGGEGGGETGGETGGGSGPAVAGGGEEGGGRDCEPIRRELRAVRVALETARRVLQLFETDKEIAEHARARYHEMWQEELREATETQNAAEQDARSAQATIDSIIEHMRRATTEAQRQAISRGYERASARLSAANSALAAARQRAQALSSPPAILGELTDVIAQATARINEMLEQIPAYEREIEGLERLLAECEAGP